MLTVNICGCLYFVAIDEELGNDVIVEEQSDNFGQSSKGQASQTEAQRQTSTLG